MQRTATTIVAWGVYEFVVGATLLLAPNVLLGVLGLPATDEVWIRLIGVMALVIGYFFVQSARVGHVPFYLWSMHVRIGVGLLITALVVAGLGPPVLLLFALLDVLGVTWTGLTLRAETAAAT